MSKAGFGELAGCSPDTVYRNTPALLETGLLKHAKSHVCKVENCNKGVTHFTGKWGHYTKVYEMDIAFPQNAETYLSVEHQKVTAAKCRKVGVANCGTTLTLKETPAAYGCYPHQTLPSLRTVKKVRKQVRLASLDAEELRHLASRQARQ